MILNDFRASLAFSPIRRSSFKTKIKEIGVHTVIPEFFENGEKSKKSEKFDFENLLELLDEVKIR